MPRGGEIGAYRQYLTSFTAVGTPFLTAPQCCNKFQLEDPAKEVLKEKKPLGLQNDEGKAKKGCKVHL